MTERERILRDMAEDIFPLIQSVDDRWSDSDKEEVAAQCALAALRVIERPKETTMLNDVVPADSWCPTCQHHCPYRIVGTKCIHCGD